MIYKSLHSWSFLSPLLSLEYYFNIAFFAAYAVESHGYCKTFDRATYVHEYCRKLKPVLNINGVRTQKLAESNNYSNNLLVTRRIQLT